MRTASAEDLTARSRIRDAAVDLFGRDGFGTGLRAVAESAGVSLGLIRHHYGTKESLRAACDDWVLTRVAALKTAQTTAADPVAAMLAHGASSTEHAPLLRYLLATLRDGGDTATAVVERLVSDAVGYLGAGVEAGTIRPSRDPEGRARFLVLASLGAFLLAQSSAPDPHDLEAVLTDHVARTTLPALELYTQGLLVDGRLLAAHDDGRNP